VCVYVGVCVCVCMYVSPQKSPSSPHKRALHLHKRALYYTNRFDTWILLSDLKLAQKKELPTTPAPVHIKLARLDQSVAEFSVVAGEVLIFENTHTTTHCSTHTPCNSQQPTATHYNTLQHKHLEGAAPAGHSNTLQCAHTHYH